MSPYSNSRDAGEGSSSYQVRFEDYSNMAENIVKMVGDALPAYLAQVNEAFGDLTGQFENATGFKTTGTSASFNKTTDNVRHEVYEGEAEYTIEVDVPGYPKEQIDIDLVDGKVLKIKANEYKDKGRKVNESVEAELQREQKTRPAFEKEIKFGKDVDGDTIHASLENGVLTIIVYKRVKKIQPVSIQ